MHEHDNNWYLIVLYIKSDVLLKFYSTEFLKYYKNLQNYVLKPSHLLKSFSCDN